MFFYFFFFSFRFALALAEIIPPHMDVRTQFTHIHGDVADRSAALPRLQTVLFFRLTLAVVLTDGRQSAVLLTTHQAEFSLVNIFVWVIVLSLGEGWVVK